VFGRLGSLSSGKIGKIGNFLSGVASTVVTAIGDEGKKMILEGNHDTSVVDVIASIPAVPPWLDYPANTPPTTRETVTSHILGLTKSKRNFLNAPPEDANFPFNFQESLPVAMASLREDRKLEAARFFLVPKYITEERFWWNWFYRVNVIKEAYGVRVSQQLSLAPGLVTSAPSESSLKSPSAESSGTPEGKIGGDLGDSVFTGSPGPWNDSPETWEAELEAELQGLDPALVDLALALDDRVGDDWEAQVKSELGISDDKIEPAVGSEDKTSKTDGGS